MAEYIEREAQWIAPVWIDGHTFAECSSCHRIRSVDDYCSACGAWMDREEP